MTLSIFQPTQNTMLPMNFVGTCDMCDEVNVTFTPQD